MPGHDPQLLKGVLSFLLLRLLADGEGYGFGIVVRLREAGFGDLLEGTVYPALTRLEGQGLLDSRLERSRSGPARKYYRITPAGRAELQRLAEAWAHLSRSVDRVVAGEEVVS